MFGIAAFTGGSQARITRKYGSAAVDSQPLGIGIWILATSSGPSKTPCHIITAEWAFGLSSCTVLPVPRPSVLRIKVSATSDSTGGSAVRAKNALTVTENGER